MQDCAVRALKGSTVICQQKKPITASGDLQSVVAGIRVPVLPDRCDAVNIEICSEDFVKLFNEIPTIDAGLAASIFHFGEVPIPELKKKLKADGINVR